MGLSAGLSAFTGGDTTSWPWHEEPLKALGSQPERLVFSELPDIERITGARPDLIVTTVYVGAEANDQLRKVAPVIELTPDWRRNLRIMGEALNQLELAERLIEETNKKIAGALDGLGLSEPTVALVYPGEASIRVPAHPADSRVDLFQRAGFKISPALSALATAEVPLATISMEQSVLFRDADLIVLLEYQPVAAEAWLASEVAQSLPAIRDKKLLRLKQGAIGQGMTFFGPLNVEEVLPFVREAGELVKA